MKTRFSDETDRNDIGMDERTPIVDELYGNGRRWQLNRYMNINSIKRMSVDIIKG